MWSIARAQCEGVLSEGGGEHTAVYYGEYTVFFTWTKQKVFSASKFC